MTGTWAASNVPTYTVEYGGQQHEVRSDITLSLNQSGNSFSGSARVVTEGETENNPVSGSISGRSGSIQGVEGGGSFQLSSDCRTMNVEGVTLTRR